jgi:hypothetical protein
MNQSLTVKRGLSNSPLSPPKFSITGNKPVPERNTQLFVTPSLPAIVRVIFLENVPDMVRVNKKIDGSGSELITNNVTEFLSSLDKELQSIPPHLTQISKQSWRTRNLGESFS